MSKDQAPNKSQTPNSNRCIIRARRSLDLGHWTCFGIWTLGFLWSLVFGVFIHISASQWVTLSAVAEASPRQREPVPHRAVEVGDMRGAWLVPVRVGPAHLLDSRLLDSPGS